MLLFRRVANLAVEIVAVDFIAQNVAKNFLDHTPILRSISAAIPGLGDVELRLYRLAIAAGRACNPLSG
jgi:hypothetical protein